MKDLIIETTYRTPSIDLKATGHILIQGKSIPEISLEFYQPIIKWVEDYTQFPSSKTIMDAKLEYFNTSSTKCIILILRSLENIKKQGYEVIVNWYYLDGDDDIFELGKDYADILKIDFNFIKCETPFN